MSHKIHPYFVPNQYSYSLQPIRPQQHLDEPNTTKNKSRSKSPPPKPNPYDEKQGQEQGYEQAVENGEESDRNLEEENIETQDEFIHAINSWIAMDNQLRVLNAKVQDAKTRRQKLTNLIHRFSEDNGLEYPTIDAGLDGELILCEKREYSALSFSYIHKCLSHLITEPAHVDRIMHALREHREYFVVPDIRRSK